MSTGAPTLWVSPWLVCAGGAAPAAGCTACSGPGPEGPQVPVMDEDPASGAPRAHGGQGEAHRAVAPRVWGGGKGGLVCR